MPLPPRPGDPGPGPGPGRGDLGPGDRLGPYRVVRRLGGGGMGTVHEAVDTALRRRVALKVIAPPLADDPELRARFVREARAQASLDSPHVVPVFAHGQVDGRLFIASRLVPDGDLGALLRRGGPLPRATAIDLVAQVAEGLAAAHEAGLVHRDVKPTNVLVRHTGPEGRVPHAYLADFGVAGPAAVGGRGVGTAAWMAPELHRGATAGAAADVYALGCVLWAALTGRAPYDGTVAHGLAAAHADAPVPQLPGRGASVRHLNRVLARALAKDPADRHPTAASLRDDLRGLAPSRGRGWSLARTGPVLVGSAIGAVVLGLVVASRWGGEPPPDEVAATHLAEALADADGLDAAVARCAADDVVEEHGVEALQAHGLLDDQLLLADDDGRLDRAVLDDLLSATLDCLWVSDGR